MRVRWLMMVGFTSVALASGQMTVAFAEEWAGPAAASQKAIRGLTNAGLGVVVEIPKTVYYDTVEDGPLYGLTVGVLEGLSWGLARSLVGVYEVVTFPFPIPAGYRPIYKPSYPFEAGKTDLAD
ncbi:exosortase system-associated protein, TIGR04073 family [Candidatus Methylomirabilis sp.]|uniref:exosortase system-associated protein, TIGR04073 family n=1 Tax=Candidatus Methylomirabilis sp. TaxID=2032687 RepID=UPI002A5F624E|nr:exosortase system-associated protein, TIGR04073 family [Candidatus Methylomirabilis sp.]